MYVDANPACNTLLFQMGPTAVGTSLATRQWNIKVVQNTQYFFYQFYILEIIKKYTETNLVSLTLDVSFIETCFRYHKFRASVHGCPLR